MKSFFKKVALLLALAMAVTMLPAKAVHAALDDDGLYMRKKLTLYLNGDASGEIGDFGYATVKYDKNTYTSVRFVSSNPEVAEVGVRKGGVTALSVGQTIVTATFTAEDGTTETRDCEVFVKQNAVDVWVSEKGVAKLANLTVGDDPFQLFVGRSSADGTEAWNQNGVITDGIRFASSNEDVFKVGPTKGGVEVVGPGEAYLYVWAVEGQKQNGGVDDGNLYITECKDGKIAEDDPCYYNYKWLRTTEVKKYEVKVVSNEITAEQSAWNAFEVTFPTEAEAKAAVDETAKSLTTSDAAVTENKEIIKVFEVIKNANGEKVGEVAVFIGGVGVDSNVVTVTMFDELKQETDYVIRYMDKEQVVVTTIKNVAVDMDIIITEHVKLGEDASQTMLGYKLYALGPNGQNVDITGCRDYTGWQDSVDLEDMNTNLYHAEYTFVKASRRIDFYTSDANYTVMVKATYEDWSNIVNNKANLLSKIKSITPGDNSEQIGRIIDYSVRDDGNYKDASAYADKVLAADDTGYFLIVKASLFEGGQEKEIHSADPAYIDKFTFVSSNDDKLIVNKDSGELFPPKTPITGVVGIHVYYDDQYIGTCDVTIYTKRTFTSFSAELNDTKFDYNSKVVGTAEDVADEIIVTLKPLDQLQRIYNEVGMSYDVKINDTAAQKYLDAVRVENKDGYPCYKIVVTGKMPETVTSVRIICTATYTENGNKIREMKYPVTLTVKDTANAAEKSYRIEAVDSYDMIVDNDKNPVKTKYTTLKAYSFDKDGFKVRHILLTPSAVAPKSDAVIAGNILVMQLGSDMVPVSENNGRGIVATGSGDVAFVTVATNSADRIEKVKEGSYVAYLYVPANDGKAVYKASKLISVNDTQPKVTWIWKKSSTNVSVDAEEADTVKDAIIDCIDFEYGANNNVDNGIYVTEGDYTLRGDRLTIDKVRYDLVIGNAIYVMEVAVKRTITVGVTD